MTIDPRIDLHDHLAWGPNGGRASDVPPTGKGSNPLNEEPKTAKAPAVFEIVRFTKEDGPLTKEISLNSDGSTTSDGSACIMPRGIAERIPLADVGELATLIAELRFNQAIGLGTLRWDLPDRIGVVTKDRLEQLNGHAGVDVISRTADNITYRTGEPGFALCDYDSKGIPPEIEAKLKSLGTYWYWYWAALCEALPGLKDAAYVKRRSTSAGLLRTDTGEILPGSKGLHIYIAVRDSGDIERFLKTLQERCWLAGYGWMMVGKAGQLLERSVVDRMVAAPERLVFEGKPVLVPPLDQDPDKRRPIAVEGTLFREDTTHLEHGFAGWSRRVDSLLMEIQIAAQGLQLGQESDEVLKAAAEPIDRPGCDHVNLARRGVLQQPIEAWALTFGEVVDWILLIVGLAGIWGGVIWVLASAAIKLL